MMAMLRPQAILSGNYFYFWYVASYESDTLNQQSRTAM